MTRKPWFWFGVGWAFSLVFSPRHVTAIFGSKTS